MSQATRGMEAKIGPTHAALTHDSAHTPGPQDKLPEEVDDVSSLVDLVNKLGVDETESAEGQTTDSSPRQATAGAPTTHASRTLPQPKINLAALHRAKQVNVVEHAQDSVQRLFGDVPEAPATLEAGEVADKQERDLLQEAPRVAFISHAPRWLWRAAEWLDHASGSIERLHPLASPLVGSLGLFLLVQAVLILLLARLGWI